MTQFDGETRELEGNKYTIYMLSPMVSHDLLVDVSKMVGPALGPVMDVFLGGAAAGKDVANTELDAGFFSKAASAFFGGMDKATIRNVITTMAEVTHVDGKPLKGIFEIHFRGKLHVMYMWLAFAFEVQWGKSLGALVSTIQTKGARLGMAQVSQSQGT